MYKGYTEINLTDKELARFYEGNDMEFCFSENEYILLKNMDKIVDKYCFQNDKLRKLKYKQIDNSFSGLIKPKNPQQECAMDMLPVRTSQIKVITGCFGSGKDFLMITHALEFIRQGLFEKIVWVRNNIEVKNTTPIGALPGELFDKLFYFAMPVADHVGGTCGLERLISENKIEVQHLGFIRGRDIKNSIIISSEAENLTKEHVQLLIGRVGQGSELWLNGDNKQTDKEIFKTSSGLKIAIEKLKGQKLFGYVHLEKSERSDTARLADLLD